MQVTPGVPEPLGSTPDADGVNFAVFSSVAERVALCLFDADGAERRIDLPARSGSIWHGHVSGIGDGQLYGFRVHGPWDPDRGHLCCPDKLLVDPHALEVEGGVVWNDAFYPYDPGSPDAPANNTDTAPYAPRSRVVDGAFDWAEDSRPQTPMAETVIYETHVKGFTRLHPGIPKELRGTYAGLAHPAALGHLTRLGITAVELLPVQQFIHRRRLVSSFRRNYWGYDPLCYFAPHNDYARDRTPGGAVREFKRMVMALHDAGIEVILDVVFNHTCEGGDDGPVISFRGLDNAAYYRVQAGNGLRYVDVTGTQNTLNTERPEVRRMVMDALRYWAGEMRVDGFRFDLATALFREGDHVNMESTFLAEIRDDPALANVKLIAEPWDLGDGGYQLGRFPAGWSEWNGRYRDDVRDFWNGSRGAGVPFMHRVSGSADLFRRGTPRDAEGRSPQASINFVTCHDGFTLADLVSYEKKRNDDNGEDNRDGPDDNHSWNCGVEGPTPDVAVNALRARQKRNFLVSLLLSPGVPMLLSGDELGRTQLGNNNAYCQDNEVSWLAWDTDDDGLGEFVAQLARLRAAHAVFRPTRWPAAKAGDGEATMAWFDAAGNPIGEEAGAGGPDAAPIPLQAWLSEPGTDDFLLLFNPTNEPAAFALPRGGRWNLVLDTVGPDDTAPITGSWELPPHAAGVLTRGKV